MSRKKQTIHEFIARLKARRISHCIECNREGALMVIVATPGARWECEFLDNGDVEIEVFKSTGKLLDYKHLNDVLDAGV